MPSRRSWLVALAFVFGVAACNDTTSPAPVASVIVSPDSIVADTADTLHFTVALFDAHGNPVPGRTITWSSSETTVVAVGSAGIAVTRDTGTAWVRAAADGIADSAWVRVRVPIASINFGPDTLAIVAGAAVFDLPVVRDSAGHIVARDRVTYTSSNPGVATISANGDTLRAMGLGTATIRGTADGRTDSLVVRVRTASFRALAGWWRPCGVGTDSVASCWGSYGFGWGEDSAAQPTVTAPAALAGGIRFIAIQSADAFGCGLAADSTAWCWGWAGNGRLGNPAIPEFTYTHAPVAVQTTMRFVSISATARHTCALGTDSAAYCWGAWSTSPVAKSPLQFSAPSPFVEVSAGDHFTCGVTADSSAYCWGYNYNGVLGTGDSTSRSTPALVAGGLKWVSVSAGATVACGLVAGGEAYCWGGRSDGPVLLGTDSVNQSPVPVPVKTSVQFTQLATGGEGANHTCGLTADGTAYCWGDNSLGEIGDGSTTAAVFPVAVTGGLQWQSIAASTYVTCGVSAGG